MASYPNTLAESYYAAEANPYEATTDYEKRGPTLQSSSTAYYSQQPHQAQGQDSDIEDDLQNPSEDTPGQIMKRSDDYAPSARLPKSGQRYKQYKDKGMPATHNL
jgi:hypothetical protein